MPEGDLETQKQFKWPYVYIYKFHWQMSVNHQEWIIEAYTILS